MDFFLRFFFKYLYKIFHNKNLNHNRRFWPYYKVTRATDGKLEKVFYKNKLIADNTIPLSSENNICTIIATGPSVSQMDPHIFSNKNMDYLGVNGAISLKQVKFSIYTIIDHDFIKNKFSLVEKILKQNDCYLFTTPRCLELILRKYQYKNIKCTFKIIEIITENKLELFYGPKLKIEKDFPFTYHWNTKCFSTQIFHAVYDYYTVAYIALQIAYALNYKKIVLIGLDMNQFNQPRFYETSTEKQPTRLDQDFEEINQAFDTASHFFKKNNIEVHNLSIHSEINVFKKINPNEYLSNT